MLRLAAAVVSVVIGLGLAVAAAPTAGADGNEAPGAPAALRAISAGGAHTCVVLDDHTVRCWGFGGSGRLGYGDTLSRGDGLSEMGDNLPAVDLGAGRTATAISAGFAHTCAILDTGQVKCWGVGGIGRLGYGNTASRGGGPNEMGDNLPAVDLGAGRTATAISAGEDHTCAILDNGQVKCWGAGGSGQLGYGDTVTRGDGPGEMGDSLPPVALGTGRTAVAIAVGEAHTCALLDNGQVKCWGFGLDGQLGYGDFTARGDNAGEMGDSLPPVALGTGRTATALTAATAHNCAILDNGQVKCWGDNDGGQLGYGDFDSRGWGSGQMGDNLPGVGLGTGRTATAISTDVLHTCALLDSGHVKCWGTGTRGRLGYGDTVDRGDNPGEMGDSLPAVALGTRRTATGITVGNAHSCALVDTGGVKCWGDNSSGQLGYGEVADRGDGPGEMGDNRPTVDLGTGRTVGPVVGVNVSVTADQTGVVVGNDIDYHVTVTNSGDLPLSGVEVIAPDVADCAAEIGSLGAGEVSTYACGYTTTAADVPLMTNLVLVLTDQGIFDLSETRRTPVDPVVIRPDAQIRLGAGAFAGNNVYNTTGASQTRATTVPNLGTATFTLRIQNDGNTIQTFTVIGLGTTTRYTVTYRSGPTNITAQVVAGTFTTNALAPGAAQDLTLTIKAKAGTAVRTAISRLVTVTSPTQTTLKDAVKASVTRR